MFDSFSNQEDRAQSCAQQEAEACTRHFYRYQMAGS